MGIIDDAGDAAKTVGDGVKDAAKTGEDGINESAKTVKDFCKEGVDHVVKHGKDGANKTEEAANKAGDKIKEGLQIIDENCKLTLDELGKLVRDLTDDEREQLIAGGIAIISGSIECAAENPVAGVPLIVSGVGICIQVIRKHESADHDMKVSKEMSGESDEVKQDFFKQVVDKFGEHVKESFKEFLGL